MVWSISTRGIERIRSYEQAKKHWESQPEWKNQLDGWRQLSGRREFHKRLMRQANGCSYACVLYDTALVTYHDNGSVSLRTYDTSSSVMFAGCVSPQGCDALSHKGRMFWRVRTDDGMRFYMEGDKPLLLVPTEKGNWRLTNPPAEPLQWVYDRKKGAEVQKMLRPYADWYKLTARLGGIPRANLMLPLTISSGNVIRVHELAMNPENFPLLAHSYGPPHEIRQAFYEAAGARYKAPVSHDRLPKEFA